MMMMIMLDNWQELQESFVKPPNWWDQPLAKHKKEEEASQQKWTIRDGTCTVDWSTLVLASQQKIIITIQYPETISTG